MSILKGVMKFTAYILVLVFAISVVDPGFEEEAPNKNPGLYMDEGDLEEALKASDKITKSDYGDEAEWSSSVGNSASTNNNAANNTSLKNMNLLSDKELTMPYDITKLSDADKQQLKDYVTITTTRAKEHNISPTVLYSISLLECGYKQLGSSGIYLGKTNMDDAMEKKGYKYGGVHPSTGKTITYYNYGSKEVSADGVPNTNGYKGPFQLDPDNYKGSDVYNYNTAADFAAGVFLQKDGSAGSIKTTRNYFEGMNLTPNLEEAIAVCMHNTGEAGFKAHVPRYGYDTRPEFVNIMEKAMTAEGAKEMSVSIIKNYGGDQQFKDMYGHLNKVGMKLTQQVFNKYGFTPTVTPVADATTYHSTPGDIDGNYKGKTGGYSDKACKFHNNNWQFAVGAADGKQPTWALNQEALRYVVGAYYVGRIIESTCNAALKDLGLGNGGGGGSATLDVKPRETVSVSRLTEDGTLEKYDSSKSPLNNFLGSYSNLTSSLTYYWKDSNILKYSTNPAPTAPIYGPFDEVGYKGTFPIFIQGGNEVSKTPWHYGGSATNLGESGCSLFTLASLIHGTGFGTTPLANQSSGVDGLNSEGYICLQELAKALPNGPIVAEDVSAAGYIVKTVPTTDTGLEELFSYLKQGVPFAVNVRGGNITGYDQYYNPHTVHFTNSGHFILLAGGFELGDKRYVEVVQSTYSKGGQAKDDQNALVYDFDELKSKKIIRSGSGYPVPAYTITGVKGVDMAPKYLDLDYSAPTRIPTATPPDRVLNDTIQTDVSFEAIVSGIKEKNVVRLPKALYVKVGKEELDIYITEDAYVRLTHVNISKNVVDSKTYQAGTYLGSTTEYTKYECFIGDTLIPKT